MLAQVFKAHRMKLLFSLKKAANIHSRRYLSVFYRKNINSISHTTSMNNIHHKHGINTYNPTHSYIYRRRFCRKITQDSESGIDISNAKNCTVRQSTLSKIFIGVLTGIAIPHSAVFCYNAVHG